MKTIILLCSILLASCSSNDDEECIEYIIALETECNNPDTRVTYIVSETEYQRVLRVFPEQCEAISIEDIDGNTRTGIKVVQRSRVCNS